MIATNELTPLIKGFQVAALGGGDPSAGCNLLATMACTLANLAPDDGSIVHPDGSPARLGTSLLIHGSATSGWVVDEIITEICRKQDNLLQHLQSSLSGNRKWKAQPHYVELHTADPGEDTFVMRTSILTFFVSLAYLGSISGQTSDYRLREIERRLKAANSELAEINAREQAKEQAAIKAERERLLNLPLDEDLLSACKATFWRTRSLTADAQLKAVEDTRISMAKIQEKRNLAKLK